MPLAVDKTNRQKLSVVKDPSVNGGCSFGTLSGHFDLKSWLLIIIYIYIYIYIYKSYTTGIFNSSSILDVIDLTKIQIRKFQWTHYIRNWILHALGISNVWLLLVSLLFCDAQYPVLEYFCQFLVLCVLSCANYEFESTISTSLDSSCATR